MIKYSISASKLMEYDNYLHERYNKTEADLIAYLKGESVSTFQQNRGTAFHTYIQNRDKYSEWEAKLFTDLSPLEGMDHGVPFMPHDIDLMIPEIPAVQIVKHGKTVDGIWLHRATIEKADWYARNLPDPHFFEQWISNEIEVDGQAVRINKRADVVTAGGIRDIKTTERGFYYNDYDDSFQWRLYLLNSGLEDAGFHYDVFHFINEGQQIEYHHIHKAAYPSMEDDCKHLIREFLGYVKFRDWRDMFNLKSDNP